jgi:hypothetical protein
MKRIATILLLVMWSAALLGAPPKKAPPKSGGSPPIDRLVGSLSESPLGPFFLGYKIEAGSAYMQVNPRAWRPLSKADKREIMDMMAANPAWREAGLINAWFYVGASQIGRVANGKFKPGSAWADQ